jgi:aprataxin
MPRKLTKIGINGMIKSDLLLLKSMKDEADKLVKSLDTPDVNIGFHSVPSMSQLHLHVISRDFDSTCLKNKKHWNSLTSSFFRRYYDVVKEIERDGVLEIDEEKAEASLKLAMRCPICKIELSNIPKAKDHHKACYASSLK